MASEGSETDRWKEIQSMIDCHQSSLIRYAASILRDTERAKDVAQDVFAKLCKQPLAEEPRSLQAYLFRAVRNRALDVMKKEGRMAYYESPEVVDNLSQDRAQAERKHSETIASLFELVEELPSKKKEVVLLKFQQGLSYQEISDVTGIGVGNVGYLIHHALRELKDLWRAAEASSR